jgi:uncharacterized membrane protein YkvA (DUF1232 family)
MWNGMKNMEESKSNSEKIWKYWRKLWKDMKNMENVEEKYYFFFAKQLVLPVIYLSLHYALQ